MKNSFPYLDVEFPIAFAHRGGALDSPENSIAAFQAAVDIGYRYLETDVHLTLDGRVIAFHDDVLDRVTDMEGRVCETPYSQIKNALIDGRSEIPLLEDLLESFPHARFNIDPKDDLVSEPLAKLIKKTASADRICVASFSDKRTTKVSRLVGKDLCTGVGPSGIARLRIGNFTSSATSIRGECVQVPVAAKGIPLITRIFVDRVHSIGKVIHAWTINEAEEMHRLLDLGIDGIMTDRPKILKEVLVERGQWGA